MSLSSFLSRCLMTLIGVTLLTSTAYSVPWLIKPKLAILPEPTFIFYRLPKMSLQDAVLLALRNNPTIRSSEIQRVVDKFALAVARNQFEPQYQLTGQANYANGSLPGYNVTPQVSLTTPYGTQITTNVSNSWDGSGSGSAVAQVTLQQPLLRGFGRKIVEAQLYTAIQQEKINQLTLKNSVINTIISVTQAYYQLVQDYNNLITNQLALENTRETLRQTLIQIEAGKAPGTDRIVQETDVASALLTIEGNKNTILQDYQNLIVLLGLDPDVKVNIVKTIYVEDIKLPTLAKSIQIALANNISYQQSLLNYKVTERSLLVAQNQQKWDLQLNATASRTLTATGTSAINTGINSTVPTTTTTTTPTIPLFTPGATSGGSATSKSLTFSLNVPIDNLPLKQQLINAKISIQQAQLDLENQKKQLITQVTNNYRTLLSQLEQIKLAEKNVELAQQSLNIEILKYNSGRSTSINVTTQRNNLTNSQLTLISQKITYLNTLETFFQTLGTTLEKWKVALTY